MPEITLITTSPFQGLEQIDEVTVNSLKSQTCKDFEWIYLDGFYDFNKDYFNSLKERLPFKIIHAPLLNDWTRPHLYHWEPYNSAVLLSNTKYFLRWGRYRYYCPQTVEVTLNYLRRGYCVDFSQVQCDNDLSKINDPWPNMKFDERNSPHSSCGMFAMSKSVFVNILNGNDEVGCHWHHHEDVETNRRMKFVNHKCITMHGWLRRFVHDKNFKNIKSMNNPPPSLCKFDNKNTCLTISNNFDARNYLNKDLYKRYDIDNFDFWVCRKCNALMPGNADEYLVWVASRKNPQAMYNVLGSGRNLASIDRRINKMSVSDKINEINNSFKSLS